MKIHRYLFGFLILFLFIESFHVSSYYPTNPYKKTNDTDYNDPHLLSLSNPAKSSVILPEISKLTKEINTLNHLKSINFTSSNPIVINGDQELISSGFNGSGTEEDPVIISKLNITTSLQFEYDSDIFGITDSVRIGNYSSAINIYNTSLFVSIKENSLQGIVFNDEITNFGIFVNNTSNISILNNSISKFDIGIASLSSQVSRLENNHIYDSAGNYESESPTNIEDRGDFGVALELSQASSVSGNIIETIKNDHGERYPGFFDGVVIGINIYGSSVDFIENNTIINLESAPVAIVEGRLWALRIGSEEDLDARKTWGIFDIAGRAEVSKILTIKNNDINNIRNFPEPTAGSSNQELHPSQGIYLVEDSYDVGLIEGNNITNTEWGIHVESATNTFPVFQDNIISKTGYGMRLSISAATSQSNDQLQASVINNNFANNQEGIRIVRGNQGDIVNILIEENIFKDNQRGIQMTQGDTGVPFGLIKVNRNEFITNELQAVKIASTLVERIEITRNNLYNNNLDNPLATSEMSDETQNVIFRYNYIDSFQRIDENGDGIADDRYHIDSFISQFIEDPYPTVKPNPSDIQFRPPSVITWPVDGSTLNEIIQITWLQDIPYSELPINFSVELKEVGSTQWTQIIASTQNTSISFDPSEFENSNYELRIVSNDTVGFSQISNSILITIDIPPPDSDNDGLIDEDEVNIYGTDPFSSDTDDDGLSDGDELNLYNTNPLDSDSDDDGFNDGEEIVAGTDPLDPDSFPEEIIPSVITKENGGSNPLFAGIGLFFLSISILTVGGYVATKYVKRYRRLTKEDAIDYLETAQNIIDQSDEL